MNMMWSFRFWSSINAFHSIIWPCEQFVDSNTELKHPKWFIFISTPLRLISNCSFLFCLAHKSNFLHEEEPLLCSKCCERVGVKRTRTCRHTDKHTQPSPASTCRQCGEEIRLHQMHNVVLISMPTNLTQSKKVTLCRNQKEASLFQNCMLGSLQADRFREWDSLKRNVFHLRLNHLVQQAKLENNIDIWPT